MRIELNELIVDSEVDIRTAHDTDAISRYAESVGSLPPVTVFDTPEGLLLAGGFHRVAAAHLAGEFEIEADVRQGSRDEAMVFAALDNATHGVPLTKGERNTAIRRLKRLGWKQDDIAAGFGLSKSRVSHILRDELRNATPDGYGERVEEARLLVRSLEEARWRLAEVFAEIDAEAWDRAREVIQAADDPEAAYRDVVEQVTDWPMDEAELLIGEDTVGTWWGWVQTWKMFGDPDSRHPDLDFEGHYQLARSRQ